MCSVTSNVHQLMLMAQSMGLALPKFSTRWTDKVCTVFIISDPLREKHPFANIFQNAVGAPKVTLVKKLIPNLNNFWSRNGISVL